MKRKGIVAVELAICLPLLIMLLLMTIDMARLALADSVLRASAEAGARYGAISDSNAHDSQGIIDAASQNFSTDIQPTIHSRCFTNNGTEWVRVRASVDFTWFTPLPGLPTRLRYRIRYPVFVPQSGGN